MTGYVRNDTANNIAAGGVINASDLDGEFDAIVDAMAVTGHSHDGSTGEGAPVEVLGPAQDIVASASSLAPKANNTYDLGTASLGWKDMFVVGTATLATVDINGGAIDSTTVGSTTPAAGAFTTLGATGIATLELGTLVTTTDLPIAAGGTGASTATGALTNLGFTATIAELNILDGVTADAAELNILDGVTATAAELNILDGVTADAGELNKLDGVTASTSELNTMDGITASTSELNILDGVTADAAELNKLDGATATTAEINHLSGVTGAIQTALDAKAPSASPTLTGTITYTGTNLETALDAKAPLADPDITGELGAEYIRLSNTTDVSLSSTHHAFQIGPSNGFNLAIDSNEIGARNNGATTDLYLNSIGGNVLMSASGDRVVVRGLLDLDSSDSFYQSSDTTITTDTTQNFTHGLGGVPDFYMVYLVCDSADQGYSVGDLIPLNIFSNGTGGNGAHMVKANSTRVEVRIRQDVRLAHESSDSTVTGSTSDYDIRVVAFKFT